MKCILCGKEIERYNEAFNRLKIDDEHAHDICGECVDKFIKWQGKKFALLFPTKTMKKRYGEGSR